MTSDQIDQLGKDVGASIPELLGDLAPHIREAAAGILEETQDSEKAKPKLNISIAVSVNLAAHPPTYELKGSVSLKRTAKMDGQLDDPEQPKLSLEDAA